MRYLCNVFPSVSRSLSFSVHFILTLGHSSKLHLPFGMCLVLFSLFFCFCLAHPLSAIGSVGGGAAPYYIFVNFFLFVYNWPLEQVGNPQSLWWLVPASGLDHFIGGASFGAHSSNAYFSFDTFYETPSCRISTLAGKLNGEKRMPYYVRVHPRMDLLNCLILIRLCASLKLMQFIQQNNCL